MIHLDPILPSHKDLLFKWRNDPNVYKWCRQYDLLDWSNHCHWFDSLGSDKSVKMYIIVGDQVPVGVCGITDIDLINQRAEFSLYIATEFQKKGYGKQALLKLLDHAFKCYPFHLIWGESFDGNPAIKIFSDIGFKLDGIRKDFYRREGKFIDAHLFSITREEFYVVNTSFDNNL